MIHNIIFKTYPGYNKKKALKAFPSKEKLINFTLLKLIEAIKNFDISKINLQIVIDAPTKSYIRIIEDILIKSDIDYKIILNNQPYGNIKWN